MQNTYRAKSWCLSSSWLTWAESKSWKQLQQLQMSMYWCHLSQRSLANSLLLSALLIPHLHSHKLKDLCMMTFTTHRPFVIQASAAASLLPPQQFFFMSPVVQALFLNGACQLPVEVSTCVMATQDLFGPSTQISIQQYMWGSRMRTYDAWWVMGWLWCMMTPAIICILCLSHKQQNDHDHVDALYFYSELTSHVLHSEGGTGKPGPVPLVTGKLTPGPVPPSANNIP
jgi:hypothetical protein